MVKEFKVKMTQSFIELASKPIRTKNHIVMLMLEAIPLLTNGYIVDRTDKNYIVLRIDKMKRLFFVIENKIFSFNFPFNVEMNPGEDNPTIYDSHTEIQIEGINHAVITTTYNEIFCDDEYRGMLDLDSEVMLVLESFEMISNKDLIWQVLKKLLVFESGYLRYDYDEEREDGKLHPLHHLDINYSSDSTFKVGINNLINCDYLIDILDINTDSHYISK
jgi:hypothetical protein